MIDSKALTQIPMGTIKQFIEENFNTINFSEKADSFFENEFLGDVNSFTDLVAIKDGNPNDITKWLKNEYDIDMELKGDYAIATVLALLLEFKKKAVFKEIEATETQKYGGGLHDSCKYFKMNVGEYSIGFFKLSIKNEDFELYISEDELDNETLNSKKLFSKNAFEQNQLVNLTLPMVKYKEEIDLSDVFKGSTMIANKDNNQYEVEDAKTLTMMDLGLDKVEIKQVAAMTMVLSGCASFDINLRHTIKDNFFLYVRYNNKLLFGTKMLKEDFVQDEELDKIKEVERLGNEDAKRKNEQMMEEFQERMKNKV